MSQSVPARVGLALDIDGVLVRGSQVLDIASSSLKRIHEKKVPHVFLTNGGSMTEEKKAEDLSNKLGVEIKPSQVILSHTPMKKLVQKFGDKKVLLIGNEGCKNVAANYGFRKFITTADIHYRTPAVFPARPPMPLESEVDHHENHEIAAALILFEPTDWALDMQILTDVLLGDTIHGNNMQQKIPLYACNPDVVYMDVHHHPRFTQGAFVTAFKGLFEHYTRAPLEVEYCGKPCEIQYRTAEELIHAHARDLASGTSEVELPQVFYGIGDNPKADIRGANAAGDHWNSVLVKTGVFKGEGNDEHDVADIVTENLFTALDQIFSKHGLE